MIECRKNCKLRKCCEWKLSPICALCVHCKIQNGMVSCKQDLWTDYRGNHKEFKSVAIYNPYSKVNDNARHCMSFEKSNLEE